MTEPERKPVEMMSPRQHYSAATRLITVGLDKVERVMQGGRSVDAGRVARSELIALAAVHARLATVPQAQFDAWRAGANRAADAKAAHDQSLVESHTAEADPTGRIVHAGTLGSCEDSVCRLTAMQLGERER